MELQEVENSEEHTVATLEPPYKRFAFSRILGDSPDKLPVWRSMLESINQDIDSYLKMNVADIDQSPLK